MEGKFTQFANCTILLLLGLKKEIVFSFNGPRKIG